ncbi:D-2-hydroxyacid dehydrogenase family protein [Leisingera caerulea]|uniref:D-2-hydroxyacid dehydrogenase family protein n=1 Tax=Leisingera caerulea TaxID=506591 RepID=UPI0021A88170|nr:D-2-hydroxyacid dehydrogenase family protein [Leisingera caerulea]UWQ86049.1 D-2-hydroxyacid dehydrogenase family protein [Leisingera caerulea]
MTKLKVAILDDYSGVALQAADWDSLNAEIVVFTDPIPLGALSDTLHPFDVICLMRERTPFPESLITALPNLRLLVTTGPRNQSIDLAAARANGITVCGTRSRKTTTAELTMTLMLTLSRNILPEAASLREGGWQGPPGRDLAGRSLGLVGLGNIGQQVAKLGQAFGMSVRAWSPNLDDARAAQTSVMRASSLEALAESSDILSVHMVLSDRTRLLVGASLFEALPKGAIFLNTSRAGLVDRYALWQGMRRGQPWTAGIDVFEDEPLPLNDPWRQAATEFGDRLLLTPHLGYATQTTWELFYQDTVSAIAAFQSGSVIREL